MTAWQSPEFDSHEHVSFFSDAETGLRAVVAIHSTALGPAVGGTRFRTYPTETMAVDDALRLSRAMSYKCALAGLPLGGGKAVIIGDPANLKTEPLLKAYGGFLNRVGDRFSTGEDVGFTLADCEIIRSVSPYVAGTDSRGAGDPSIHTALGAFHGLRAVLETRFDRPDFDGVHVAVQGLGSVGWRLCEYLHAAGARLSVADVDHVKVARAEGTFDAAAVAPNAIHAVEADIYAPCALGGVVNADTLPDIRAKAIAGAANNQLASREIGAALQARGILYAPDYVINAGGVVGAVEELATIPGRRFDGVQPVERRLERIHDRLIEIFGRARQEGVTPEATAMRMAREMIAA
jgi:leucine dehydrogenase